MWQGINNITGFKGNKPATVNIAVSLTDELNNFYARFEADNTAHTESAPTAAAEEVSPLSLSVTDVTRSFKRVNILKAVPSHCTLLSPTWKIRTPMWGCCSWIIVQHLTPKCLPHWLRSSRLWDWTDLCAAGSWTSWQAEVRWSELATTPHLLWSSTLVLLRAASSAHSCSPCIHTTVQPHTALTSSSNLQMTQRW